VSEGKRQFMVVLTLVQYVSK